MISIPTDIQQDATNKGTTGIDVAGSLQDPTLQVSPEKPSSFFNNLKPGVPCPITCITSNLKINVIQGPGGKYYVMPS